MAPLDLRVNFSDEEAASEGRSFEPIPSGQYYCRLTDLELKECGPESKNAGKNYWAAEFTVQDGEYEGRKLWTNVMLFDGALYTLAQLLKATGYADALKTGVIPDADDLISKECIVIVKKMRDAYREQRDGDGEPQWKNEVKGIKAFDGTSPSPKKGATASVAAGPGSLLP